MGDPSSLDPGPIPNPFTDDKGGGDSAPPAPEEDPYRSKVLWSEVPHITPTDSGGGGDAPSAAAPTGAAMSMDIGAVRDMLTGLLGTVRGLSDQQDRLVDAVHAAHTDSFWGEKAGWSYYNTGYMNQPEGDMQFSSDSAVAGPAKQFAPIIREMQEKALQRVATALQATGEWMAGVDQSAGAYASADHAARLPEIPAVVDPGTVKTT